LPVVSSRAASLPEVGGDLVHYADAEDPQSISRALVRALEASRPATTAIQRHFQKFSWDHSALAHGEILYKLGSLTKESG